MISFPQELHQRILDLAGELQQIPAPTHAESQRAARVCTAMQQAGLVDVSIDPAGNACARLPGTGTQEARPVVVSAHLDTVFPPETDLSLSFGAGTIAGPGIGDNSISLAGMLGLVWLLQTRNTQLPGDLWLAATVGEEGLGNLKGMHALVDRFGDQPLAYIVLEGMGLGDIYHRGLAVQRYRIRMETAGGHAWIDYGTPSSIHEMACLVTQLAALPVPREPRSSLNIGIIRGGTSINTIAAQAELELDLRSESAGTLHRLAQRVERLIQQANRPGVSCTAEIIGKRPAGELPVTHPLVQLAWHILQELDIRPIPGIGSTDANVPISHGFSAICIGLTDGNGAHTPAEIIRTEPLYTGMEQLYQIVTRVWNMQ